MYFDSGHATAQDEPASYWQTTAPSIKLTGDLPRVADVVVIGGGLLGTATAYWLARMGAAPVLLERTALAHGATGRNGGFVTVGTAEGYAAAKNRLGPEVAQAVWQLTLQNRALLRQVIAEEAFQCDYREPGHLSLILNPEQYSHLEESAALLQADGFVVQLLNRVEVQELIQTPIGSTIHGALFYPETGLVHSARLVQELARAAECYGAQLYTAEVQQLEAVRGSIRIHTAQTPIEAATVIVAANAWTSKLLPTLTDIIKPVRGQVLAYAPRSCVFSTSMSAALTPTGEYWQQTPDGTIIVGGCRAAAQGYDVGVDVNRPTSSVQSALEQVLPQLFPQISRLSVSQRWAGLMAFTPDYLPIVDQVRTVPGAWVVGGFSGHGMPFGMALGHALASAALNNHMSPALHPFRLDRPTLLQP